MRTRTLAYVKKVRARGRDYLYFDTGVKENGRIIYKRLPDPRDPTFGGVYAALLGHRSRKAVGVLTVPKLVKIYEESPKFEKLADNTKKLYRTYLGRFVEQLPTAPAGEIERHDIVKLLDKMADKPGAAKMMRASIAALYKWARTRGHVANRPTDDIKMEDGGEHEPWPDELLNAALVSDDEIVRLAVYLLYFTAQRVSDVCAMRWGQISDDIIIVRQQKTGKEIPIAIHPRLSAELAGRTRDLRTILLNKHGKPFNENSLRYILQKWAKGRGAEIVPHGLRKNAVNSLLGVGCSDPHPPIHGSHPMTQAPQTYADVVQEEVERMKRPYGKPVETLTELAALDDDEMLDGYLDGFRNEPEPSGNRSKSYWHGWCNGMFDAGFAEGDAAQAILARRYIKSTESTPDV